MRIVLASAFLALVVACGPAGRSDVGGDDGDDGPPAGCVGLQCQVVNCASKGLPPTTISGAVYAPNGTLPLYGATVYVPNVDPGPLVEGVTCGQCDTTLPGDPVVQGISDVSGKFSIENVPVGTDIPLFVTIGKWRRKVTIPTVTQCTDNPLPASITSLPKTKLEGDIPKMAMATGAWDKLECLVLKLGVSASEFTNDSGSGRIHLYVGNGADTVGASAMSPASEVWGNMSKLEQYDILLNSCEGDYYASEKTQAMMDNVKAYADMGGRVFLSHYHSVWIDGDPAMPTHAPAVWPEVATCGVDGYLEGTTGVIDQTNNPKGTAFATWMSAVGGSSTPGTVEITETRQSCSAVDPSKAERWVFMPIDGVDYPQNFQFTTPQEVAKDQRCGKVVFSDMHVSPDSSGFGTSFPSECDATAPLTPQEKALAFMFFDVAACVGQIL